MTELAMISFFLALEAEISRNCRLEIDNTHHKTMKYCECQQNQYKYKVGSILRKIKGIQK